MKMLASFTYACNPLRIQTYMACGRENCQNAIFFSELFLWKASVPSCEIVNISQFSRVNPSLR